MSSVFFISIQTATSRNAASTLKSNDNVFLTSIAVLIREISVHIHVCIVNG